MSTPCAFVRLSVTVRCQGAGGCWTCGSIAERASVFAASSSAHALLALGHRACTTSRVAGYIPALRGLVLNCTVVAPPSPPCHVSAVKTTCETRTKRKDNTCVSRREQ